MAYNDHSPNSQRRSKAVRVQQPLRDKWKDSTSDATARPNDRKGKTFPGNEPLIDEIHGWEVQSHSADAEQDSLCGEKSSSRVGERRSDQGTGQDHEADKISKTSALRESLAKNCQQWRSHEHDTTGSCRNGRDARWLSVERLVGRVVILEDAEGPRKPACCQSLLPVESSGEIQTPKPKPLM
jgi:hypothetical protein